MKKIFILAGIISLSLACSAAETPSKSEKSDKSINVSLNTWGLLLSSPVVTADFAMGENMTIGPSFGTASYSGTGVSASSYQLGGSWNYWLSGNRVFTDSWSMNARALYTSATSGSATASGFNLSGTANYNWFWDGGFNMNAGAGLQYITLDLSGLSASFPRISGVLPALAWNVGYAF
jgi:hypothetical protein